MSEITSQITDNSTVQQVIHVDNGGNINILHYWSSPENAPIISGFPHKGRQLGKLCYNIKLLNGLYGDFNFAAVVFLEITLDIYVHLCIYIYAFPMRALCESYNLWIFSLKH